MNTSRYIAALTVSLGLFSAAFAADATTAHVTTPAASTTPAPAASPVVTPVAKQAHASRHGRQAKPTTSVTPTPIAAQ